MEGRLGGGGESLREKVIGSEFHLGYLQGDSV